MEYNIIQTTYLSDIAVKIVFIDDKFSYLVYPNNNPNKLFTILKSYQSCVVLNSIFKAIYYIPKMNAYYFENRLVAKNLSVG